MDSRNSLYITDDETIDVPDNGVTVDELLERIDPQEYQELKDTTVALDIDTGTRLPLFDSLWKHVTLNDNGSLFELVFLYEELEREVAQRDVSVVVADIAAEKYRSVLSDLEENCDIEIRETSDEIRSERQNFFSRFSGDIFDVVASFTEQIVWLLLSTLWVDRDQSLVPETVFFPFPGREGSTRPVVERVTPTPLVVVQSNLAKLFLTDNEYLAGWRDGDVPVWTYGSLVSLTALYQQCLLLVRLVRELVFTQQMNSDLERHLRKQRETDVTAVVDYAVTEAIRGNVDDMQLAVLAEQFLTGSKCERIVLGGNSPRDRMGSHVARERGIETYYLPHSIVHPEEIMYPHHPDTTMFLSGDFDATYLRETFSPERLPTLRPFGRPYFGQLTTDASHSATDDTGDDRLTVMLATQDDEDHIREAFVTDALAAADEYGGELEVIVKLHPNESVTYYESLFDDLDLDLLENTTIVTDDLEGTVRTADIVVTINSNVGVEAMLLSTPTVCLNEWEPIIPTYPYASEGPAPLLRSRAEAAEFFRDLTPERVAEMTTEQSKFGAEEYAPLDETPENIAAELSGD